MHPAWSGEIEHTQARGESRGLLLPVEDQGTRNDDQHGALPFAIEQGQDLYGFAESHIVRKAAAESKLPEKPQPGESFALIIAQSAGKTRRRIRRLNASKVFEFLPDSLETFVECDLGL